MELTKKDIELIKKYISIHGRDERISKFEQSLVANGDRWNACKYAEYIEEADLDALMPIFTSKLERNCLMYFAQICDNRKHDVKPLQDVVILSSPIQIYNFALNINGADVLVLEDALIKTKEYSLFSQFARFVKGADISKLEDSIIETADASLITEFTANTSSVVNVEKLEQAIIKLGDINSITSFAKHVKGANIKKLQDIVEAQGKAENMFEFGEVPNVDLESLSRAIAKTKNAQYICMFAGIYKLKDIKPLQEAIINSGNAEYIYEFARDIQGADIKALCDAIIFTRDPEYIVKFATRIHNADVGALQEAIIKSGNAEEMVHFAYAVKKADIKALQKAVIATGDLQCIRLFAFIKGAKVKELNTVIEILRQKEIEEQNEIERKNKPEETIEESFDKILESL